MSKHKDEIFTLAHCINYMQSDNPWYEVMGIDIPGMEELEQQMAAVGDDQDKQQEILDKMSELEDEYIKANSAREIEVSWPELVVAPRLNGDAYYRFV